MGKTSWPMVVCTQARFKNVFMISNEGVGDAIRDGLRGANHSNSLAIARICNDADRPKPRPHTQEEIVNTFLRRGQRGLELVERLQRLARAEGIGVDLG